MKFNKKIIFILVGLVLVLVTAVNTVFANDDNKAKVEQINNARFSCNDLSIYDEQGLVTAAGLEQFQESFGAEIVDKNQKINISVDPDKLNGVEFGVFIKFVTNDEGVELIDPARQFATLNTSTPTFSYDYPDVSGEYTIELRMTSPGDTDCKTGVTTWTSFLVVEGSSTVSNMLYDTNICQIIRGETSTPTENYTFMNTYNELNDANKAKLRTVDDKNYNEVTLCTRRSLNSVGISEKSLLTTINNIVSNLKLTQTLSGQSFGDVNAFITDLENRGYTKVTDPANGEHTQLYCDNYVGLTGEAGLPDGYANLEEQEDVGLFDKGYYTSVNQGKFYHENVSEVNEYCDRRCVEAITVSYGPPVAAKGNICFEYKVKVVSDMQCESVIDYSKLPKLESACLPTPVCNSTSAYRDQGGPAEDFDACVLEKDGGEYTQEAIDSCYKEVYGYDDGLADEMSLFTDYSATATKINGSGLILRQDTRPGAQYFYNNAVAIMNEVNNTNSEGAGGFYYRDGNGTIHWDRNGHDANSYFSLGSYYFNGKEKTLQTILNLDNYNYGRYSGTLSGGYTIRNGFKVGINCHDSCSWTGCTDSKYLNNSDALNAYNTAMNEWNAAMKECAGEASCQTKTTEFDMSVDLDDKGIKDAQADIKSDSENGEFNSNTKPSGDEDLIIDNGACYGDGETNNKYMTEWTFPNSYVNLKTGEVSFDDKGDDAGWHEYENKFCLPLDQPDVNTLWFDWYVQNAKLNPETGLKEPKDLGLGNKNLTDAEKVAIEAQIKENYNINASTTNFGEFGWNINISCFFASKSTNTPIEDDNSSSIEDNGEQTVNNYSYRSIPLEDINSGEAEIIGYNWSEAAINLNNGDYFINPIELKEEISVRGNEIYNGDDYLDYHFVLTTSDIAEIRNYNNSRDSYIDYFDDALAEDHFYVDEESKINFYVSSFLRETLKNSAEKLPASNNGCNNLLDSKSCERIGG